MEQRCFCCLWRPLAGTVPATLFGQCARHQNLPSTRWRIQFSPSWALGNLYERIAEVDFSHHVLQFHVGDLRVVPVPRCGWVGPRHAASGQRAGEPAPRERVQHPPTFK